jgi:uncharacterized RDD family membrane protein YckC
MAERNPYDPPEAAVEDRTDPAEVEFAGRGQRFAAAMIDGIIGMAVMLPVMSAMGIWRYASTRSDPPLTITLLSLVLGFVVFALIHGYLLAKNGQTVGKRLLRIRIVGLDNELLPLQRLLGLRYLPVMASSVIPGIGPFLSLADVLFIFRSDRRCVHDLIAGTKVVRA